MPSGAYPRTAEMNQRMSKVMKAIMTPGLRQRIGSTLRGRISPLRGYTLTEEHKRKIGEKSKGRQSRLGQRHSDATKLKMSQSRRGTPKAPEHIEKIRQARLGQYPTEEAKLKMSEARKAAMTLEMKQQIGDALRGSNSPCWKGGISNEPYPLEFDWQLKETIRIRDNRTCQLCGTTEDDCPIRLPIHHIDYDKQDISPMNLISLCSPCNGKVNGERVYYQVYFEAKIREIYKAEEEV